MFFREREERSQLFSVAAADGVQPSHWAAGSVTLPAPVVQKY